MVNGQVVPILRAGLVLLEQAATVLPNSQTMHVGYVRNEETLEVSLPGALPALCCWLLFVATSLSVRSAPHMDHFLVHNGQPEHKESGFAGAACRLPHT